MRRNTAFALLPMGSLCRIDGRTCASFGRATAKTPSKKLSPSTRSMFLELQLKHSHEGEPGRSAYSMGGSPVWTQYIDISTVHDDPKQCEHVLSQYFVTVTWCVTVT